jgi:hypothetical protein
LCGRDAALRSTTTLGDTSCTKMLLSSSRTRSIKTTTPIFVYAVATGVVVWDRRHELLGAPGMAIWLLLVTYACAAWVLWRPWRLKVADHVEEKGDVLLIRRRRVEMSIPYSDVEAHEFLRIGNSSGVKLTFRTPTALGREIGFYLDESLDSKAVPIDDPGEHLERQLERYRHGRTA